MKNILEQIVSTNKGKATSIINRKPELLEWINSHSDKNCITLRQKIYSALHNEPMLWKNSFG